MDLKRYEKINGREALKRMLDGEHIYFTHLSGNARSFFFDNNNQLKGETETGEIFKPEVTVTEIIERYNWYIKKPFDVRAEMLARPNEWVGAFQDLQGKWHRVGFDAKSMIAVENVLKMNTPNFRVSGSHHAHSDELDHCIPIEDVPKEELA